MLNLRALGLAWCSGLLVTAAVAQSNPPTPIHLGPYPVHPTHILATFVHPSQSTSVSTLATLQSMGLTIKRRYSLVPGGVLFDLQPTASLQSVAPPTPQLEAQRLLAKMAALRASGLFSYVGPDYYVTASLVTPNDTAYKNGTLWGLNNYGQNGGVPGADVLTAPTTSSSNSASNAWDITTGSTNVIVAVIDTGVRYTHKDLASQMWHNPKEIPGNGIDDDNDGYVDDVYGINAIAGNGDPMDDMGHGTHVAGIIGAAANNGYPDVGVNWHIQIMACKFLGTNGGGYDSDAITCIDYAVAHGARILNNSWGGYDFDQLLLDAIVSASTNNVLFVAAAGNDSINNDITPDYPASYAVDNVISVAALDRKDKLAFFSNYGQNTVDIGAPGVDIFSCWAGSDTDYQTESGTSMATPYVSGVAALILAAYPNASMDEVRTRILETAVPVADLQGKSVTGGRVNAYSALTATANGKLEVVLTPPTNAPVLVSTKLPIFVKVNDLFPVTNATVQGTVVGTTNVFSFHNDGQPPDVVSNDNIYSTYVDLTPYTNTTFSNRFTFALTIAATNNFPATNTIENYSNTVTYVVIGHPKNDAFAGADKIPPAGAFGANLILATNTYATTEPGEPAHAGDADVAATLWWNYSPATSSPVIVDTAGSSFDTVVAVYTGNSLTTLTPVASAAGGVNGETDQANVTFDAQAGNTYRIVVGGYDTNQLGSLRLRVEPNGKPDLNPPVVQITGPVSGTTYTTTNKVVLTGTTYDPTPDASGVRQVLVQVGTDLPSSANGTTNWNRNITLVQGENPIRVTAADYAGNVSTPQTMMLFYEPPGAPNDIFGTVLSPSSPYFLQGTNGTSSVSNVGATKETGEPNHAGNDGGKSVWWSWKAPADGVLTLNTFGSSFDTLLGLYTGNYVFDLTTVASNDDAHLNSGWSLIVTGVHAGQVYRIAVDGFGGASGTVVLNYSFKAGPIVALAVTASTGGTTSPSGTNYVQLGSSQTLTATPAQSYDFYAWQGGVIATANPLTFTVNTNTTVQAVFRPHAYTDGFESGDFSKLPWQFGGDSPQWYVTDQTAASGKYCARSGAIGNSQTNSLYLEADFRGGTGKFAYKVSSEQGWDLLQFLIDGQVKGSWSGEAGWSQFEFTITPGHHTVEWRYLKDPSNSVGLDAGFIDNIDLPLRIPVDSTTPARLSVLQEANGLRAIQLQGQTNQVYVLQSSTDLRTWSGVSTNIATYGEIILPLPLEKPTQFYRAIATP